MTVTDHLLDPNDIEEGLSRAYVKAIAAHAGYQTAESDFDKTGIDLTIEAGGKMRPKIDVQLKASYAHQPESDGSIKYPLKRRNYDLLIEATQTPRMLVFLCLPTEQKDWLEVTTASLILRKCAFWMSLKGLPATQNASTVTITIPAQNVFNVESLRDLMEKSRSGALT